jgi:hypothetical protein
MDNIIVAISCLIIGVILDRPLTAVAKYLWAKLQEKMQK